MNFFSFLAFGLALTLSAPVVQADGTQPAFDCNKAASDAEELICADAKLAALDRRMARTYKAAIDTVMAMDTGQDTALKGLRATQRGWIKGRDDCWKADDLRDCVAAAYLQRDGTLVAQWLLQDPGAVASFQCDNTPANVVTAYFFDTELPSVRLEYGDRIDTGSLTRTASGSRYNASFGRFLWIKGQKATFSWVEGTEVSCTLQN